MAVVDGPRLAGADRHGSVAALCRLLRSRDGGVSHLGGAPDTASTSAIAYFRACHIAAHGRGRPVSGRLYSDGVFLRPAARLACIPVRQAAGRAWEALLSPLSDSAEPQIGRESCRERMGKEV